MICPTDIHHTRPTIVVSKHGWRKVCEEVLRALVKDVKERGELDYTECFIDGNFVIAKKGALGGKTKRGKSTKLMEWQMALVLRSISPDPLEVLRRMK